MPSAVTLKHLFPVVLQARVACFIELRDRHYDWSRFAASIPGHAGDIKRNQPKEAAQDAASARWRARAESQAAARQELRDRLDRAYQIFEVITDIGVMLFRLEVVDRAKAKAAWKEVNNVICTKDTLTGIAFEAAKKQKRYGLDAFSSSSSKERIICLIAGLAFCAACFPMYIYWGYGCGKFNELGWISSMLEEGAFGGMDQRIMALKTSGLPEKVLLKQPAGIDKETPRLEPKPIESVTEKTREFLQMFYDTYDRDGYGIPKDPRIIPISDWKFPEAYWMHKDLYNNGDKYGVGNLIFHMILGGFSLAG